MTFSTNLHAGIAFTIQRDDYRSISQITGTTPYAVMERFAEALPQPYFLRHSRSQSLYGYHPEEDVAVIQARHHLWNAKREHGTTHKTYFLCGRNEITREAFRHPVSAAAVNAAIRKAAHDPAAPVRGAQRWMWSVTEKQLEAATRQGDVLIVPERAPKVVAELGTIHVIGGSHEIRAARIIEAANGRVYASNPTLLHRKDQHDPICASEHDGWYSVRLAREEHAWNFAVRLGD